MGANFPHRVFPARMTTSTPKFGFGLPKYDQSTFFGRYLAMLDMIDPSTLLVSDTALKANIQLLQDFKDGRVKVGENNLTDADLWRAHKVKNAIVHPDTGEKIMMPFRMSGFVPFGVPIILGMLYPWSSALMPLFWQWLNQTHNACVNYSNRNASTPTSTRALVEGYVGAVGASVSVAMLLGEGVKRAKSLPPTLRLVVQGAVPFMAVAAGSS